MNILWSFSPFIVFALLTRAVPVTAALFVAAALVLRERFLLHRSFKILEIGTVLLFGGLGVFMLATDGAWSIVEVRLAVDFGLFLVVAFSMLVRQPFTLQYARESVPPEVAARPQFRTINYVLSAVWGLAFLVMTAADLMARMPSVPLAVGVVVTVAVLVGAVWFTSWYPARMRQRFARGQ